MEPAPGRTGLATLPAFFCRTRCPGAAGTPGNPPGRRKESPPGRPILSDGRFFVGTRQAAKSSAMNRAVLLYSLERVLLELEKLEEALWRAEIHVQKLCSKASKKEVKNGQKLPEKGPSDR